MTKKPNYYKRAVWTYRICGYPIAALLGLCFGLFMHVVADPTTTTDPNWLLLSALAGLFVLFAHELKDEFISGIEYYYRTSHHIDKAYPEWKRRAKARHKRKMKGLER